MELWKFEATISGDSLYLKMMKEPHQIVWIANGKNRRESSIGGLESFLLNRFKPFETNLKFKLSMLTSCW